MVHDFSTQPNLSEGKMDKQKICKGLLPTKKDLASLEILFLPEPFASIQVSKSGNKYQ